MLYTQEFAGDETILERATWLTDNPEALQRFRDCIQYEIRLTEERAIREAETSEKLWYFKGRLEALDTVYAFVPWLKRMQQEIQERADKEREDGVS